METNEIEEDRLREFTIRLNTVTNGALAMLEREAGQ